MSEKCIKFDMAMQKIFSATNLVIHSLFQFWCRQQDMSLSGQYISKKQSITKGTKTGRTTRTTKQKPRRDQMFRNFHMYR